jgi:hypothetical protein
MILLQKYYELFQSMRPILTPASTQNLLSGLLCHLLLEELPAEVVFIFNELVFAPVVEVVVTEERERPE